MKFFRIPVALAALAAIAFPGYAAVDEEETWTSIGKGIFRENFVHAYYNISEYPEMEVEVQESDQTPGRYRMVNPYANYPDYIGSPGCQPGDYYIIVDASDPVHCWIPNCWTGYQVGGNEILVVGSIADDYYNVRYGDWELADKENRCGKLEYNAIRFPIMSLLAAAWPMDKEFDEGDLSYKTTDPYGMFRLKLPGAPDIDVFSSFKGITDKKDVNFTLTLGRSLEKVRVALVKDGGDDVVSKVIAGDVEYQEITKSGDVALPYTEDGFFNFVAVPYYEGEAALSYAINNVMEIAESEDEWRKAGLALFNEAIVSSVDELIPYGFVFPSYEYYVEVEENQQKPGYLRLVDPYGDNCPLSTGYVYDHTKHWYLYIDATDPAKVVVEKTDGGIGLDLGFKTMSIWSKADRARNDESYWNYGIGDDKIAENQWFGHFENDEITFPKKSLLFEMTFGNPNGAWYEANASGNTRLKFTPGQIKGKQFDPTGIDSVSSDDTDAPAVYYHIDGTPATNDNLAPGIYIVRKGSKSSKTVIK